MIFKPSRLENGKPAADDLAFVFRGNDMLVENTGIPSVSDASGIIEDCGLDPEADALFFGTLGSAACYAYELAEDSEPRGLNGVIRFTLLRRFVGELDPESFAASGYASHLLHWHRNTSYCGRCGSLNKWHESEVAKRCPACNSVHFPKISPAIIIMVQKGDRILLAHNRNFPEGRYSLLAGFMEIGETIEETARREVREEVGIEIENIRYISSQSWPFPDSLMLGLRADYSSGDITPDGIEIVHADWYKEENFPDIPGSGTIARRIIDEYTKT